FRESGNSDSAFFYFNKGKDIFTAQNNSLGIGKCLLNMAIISTNRGDYFGGQELSLSAEPYFDIANKGQKVFIGSNFNNLAIATFRLQNYIGAIRFYDDAIAFSNDSLSTRLYLNNKANVYQTLGNYNSALVIYQKLLRSTYKNKNEYARVLSSIAKVKWLKDSNYNAKPEFLRALYIRNKNEDLWGLNASYAHLADFYFSKQPDSALAYALKMYSVAKRINSADDQLEALSKLVRLSQPIAAKNFFNRYQSLNDSLQNAHNSAKNQFALIRYETEKSKAQNLQLQQENNKKKFQIIKGKLLFYGVLFILFFVVIFAILWYKKRKERLSLETANAIRESQLKTSKKVHDVVANGLYRLMAEMESCNATDLESMIDRIEDLYERSRDISYEYSNLSSAHFHVKIATLIRSFATETCKVVIAGNTEELWQNVNSEAKFELEHVLLELMVNMKKHSSAKNVVIRFEQTKSEMLINYIDDGVGIKKLTPFNNGLTNTGNRIKAVKGIFTFDDSFEGGLKIQISLPID
ncbi:MAG: tetratricopeptide repeat protein, partial [Pedobacter sp.]|nr:tetratricopeptide repeat protein [Pedobacter sp.]